MPGETEQKDPAAATAAEVQSDSKTSSESGSTNGAFSWRAHLPNELKAEKSLETYGDDPGGLANMAKSYVAAQKLVGTTLRVPKDDAPNEEWAAFYTKLGRPEKPEGYKIDKPEKLPDGVTWNERKVEDFRRIAHEIGLTPKQLAKIVDFETQHTIGARDSAMSAIVEERKAGEKALKDKWGAGYDRNTRLARAAWTRFGGPDGVDDKYGNDPTFVEFMASVGEAMLEDGEITGEILNMGGPEQIKRQIAEIRADRKHPFHDPTHKGHAAALEEVDRLYKAAYGRSEK